MEFEGRKKTNCVLPIHSKVRSCSTHGVAMRPVTSVLWGMAAKGSLEPAGYQLSSRFSVRNPASRERGGE